MTDEPTVYDRGIHCNTEILLQMIKDLEERIIQLELQLKPLPNSTDGWYFDH